jgi:hypothetical protein
MMSYPDSYPDGVAVTPSDSTNLTTPTRAIMIGGGDGTLSAVFRSGRNTVALAGLQIGQVYPFELLRVNATGTGSTSIVAFR